MMNMKERITYLLKKYQQQDISDTTMRARQTFIDDYLDFTANHTHLCA